MYIPAQIRQAHTAMLKAWCNASYEEDPTMATEMAEAAVIVTQLYHRRYVRWMRFLAEKLRSGCACFSIVGDNDRCMIHVRNSNA